jgi:hypothetical protein
MDVQQRIEAVWDLRKQWETAASLAALAIKGGLATTEREKALSQVRQLYTQFVSARDKLLARPVTRTAWHRFYREKADAEFARWEVQRAEASARWDARTSEALASWEARK